MTLSLHLRISKDPVSALNILPYYSPIMENWDIWDQSDEETWHENRDDSGENRKINPELFPLAIWLLVEMMTRLDHSQEWHVGIVPLLNRVSWCCETSDWIIYQNPDREGDSMSILDVRGRVEINGQIFEVALARYIFSTPHPGQFSHLIGQF